MIEQRYKQPVSRTGNFLTYGSTSMNITERAELT